MSPSAPRGALELARAAYRDIALYAPDRAPCAIDLSDNTNLFGVPPAARRTLAEALDATLTRYPSLYAADLKTALARYAGVEPTEIVTGCGSDDVLDSAIRAFTEPGDAIAFPEPTFAMIPIFARMNGLRPIAVPLSPEGDFDAEALLATGARIIYLCAPNNPTSTRLGADAVERVLEQAPGLVVLDEAYAEFDGTGRIAEAPARGRLIVTRTLSKAFGLAGLRIGYAAGEASLIAEIEKSRGSVQGERTGGARRGRGADRGSRVGSPPGRDRDRESGAPVAALRALGLSPLASASNFVFVPVPDAAALAARLRARGVAVRPFTGLARIGDGLRITIGPWTMMEAALAALAEAPR
jgi:histidinol-phosphate aminotransferase